MLSRHRHLIGYLFLMAGVVVALAVSYRAQTEGRDQNRQSAVTACQAYNKVVRGVDLLVDSQRRQTRTSKQRTPAEKAATIKYLDYVLTLFPKLDCAADPIRFDR